MPLCLTHAGVADGAAPLSESYAWQFVTDLAMPPPGDPSYASTLLLNDVGVNDHTTYEEVIAANINPQNRLLVVHSAAAPFVASSSTVSVYLGSGNVTIRLFDWDGSAWDPTSVGASSPISGWLDTSCFVSGDSIRYRLLEILATTPTTAFFRIGDWRANP